MTSTRISYSEVSKDGLRLRTWEFFVSVDGGQVHAVLDSYAEGTRASIRHKFKQGGRFYERLGRANYGEIKMTPEQVPWPPYLSDKISQKILALLVVSRAKEFGRDPIPPVPAADESGLWEGAEEAANLQIKHGHF